MYRGKMLRRNSCKSQRSLKDDLLIITAILFGQALFAAGVILQYLILFT